MLPLVSVNATYIKRDKDEVELILTNINFVVYFNKTINLSEHQLYINRQNSTKKAS